MKKSSTILKVATTYFVPECCATSVWRRWRNVSKYLLPGMSIANWSLTLRDWNRWRKKRLIANKNKSKELRKGMPFNFLRNTKFCMTRKYLKIRVLERSGQNRCRLCCENIAHEWLQQCWSEWPADVFSVFSMCTPLHRCQTKCGCEFLRPALLYNLAWTGRNNFKMSGPPGGIGLNHDGKSSKNPAPVGFYNKRTIVFTSTVIHWIWWKIWEILGG